MKKGLRYFLGCATIAVSSIFVAGCGEPQISNVTIDGDDVQFRIELSDDPLSASMLTAQMKKNIFDSLNASVQLSNGQTEKIEWGDNVVITIDSTETKQWGKDTGVFKFKLQYGEKVINFYVQVDAVAVGIDASANQTVRFENVIDRGGDKAALESLVSLSLKQKVGYNDDGTDKFDVIVFPQANRDALSFEWVTEQNFDVDAMPAEGPLGVGTYQCKVSYTIPGTDVKFETQDIRIVVSPSRAATISAGASSGYGKIANSQIHQSSEDGNGVVEITLSDSISYEQATESWNGVQINQAAGNIAILKFTAPSGFRKPNCIGAKLTSYSGDGIIDLGNAVGVEETDFITSEDNKPASFYKILRFDTAEMCYRFDILWNENDVQKTYIVRLDNAVLEGPEVLELQAQWANTDNLFEGAYKLDFNFVPSTEFVNSLYQYMSIVDITENGQVNHTVNILEDFTFSIMPSVDVLKPGKYTNGLRINRLNANGDVLTKPSDVAYLDVYICEPAYSVYVATEYYSDTQTVDTVVSDGVCNVMVGGNFNYYDYPDEDLGLVPGYILGAKIDAADGVAVDANNLQISTFISFDGGTTFLEEPDITPTLQYDGTIPFVNFFVSAQNENVVGKIVIKWNDDVAEQTYLLKFDESAIFEFSKVQINQSSAIYTAYYENATDSVYGEQVKNNFSITGVVPLTGTTNTVPITIQAPLGVLKNADANYTIYKLSSAGENWVRRNLTDETFDLIASVGLDARVDELDSTSALIWEVATPQSSITDGVDNEQAFLNVELNFAAKQIYRVVINWTGEPDADVEYNIDTRFASVQVGQVLDMIAAFKINNMPANSLDVAFGTDEQEVLEIMRDYLVVSLTTAERTVQTQYYAIALAENQVFNGFEIGAEYVFDITYPEQNGTITKQVSVVIATPDILTQVMLLSDSTYAFDVVEQDETSVSFAVDGVVQKVDDNYSVDFKVFDAMSIGQDSYSTNNPNLVLKYKKLSNASDIYDSTTWEFVDDQVYTNEQSKLMLTRQLYSVRGEQEIYGYAFNISKVIAQNITDDLKPFAVEIVWSNTFSQLIVVDPMSATLQHGLTDAEIDDFVVNSVNNDSDLTVTKTATATYSITGVLAMSDVFEGQAEHRLELRFATPTGFALDQMQSVARYWFDDDEQSVSLPVTISEGNFVIGFDSSSLSGVDVIHIQLSWGIEYFDINYSFDISNLQYATYTTTEILPVASDSQTVVTVDDEMSTQTQVYATVLTNLQKAGVDRSYISSMISGSADVLALGTDSHIVKIRLAADVLHNDNIKIGVSYNNGTEYQYIPSGENINHEDYRIWYNATTFLVSETGQDAALELSLPFNTVELNAFYEIEVVWADNVMPCVVQIGLDENCLFMTSPGSVTANPGTTELRGANTVVTAGESGFNQTYINGTTNQLFNQYFNEFVLSGKADLADLSDLYLGNTFALGVVISKPTDIVSADNATLQVFEKQTNYQTLAFIENDDYQIVEISNEGKFLLLFSAQDFSSEYIVAINWDSESKYSTDYYHFALSEELLLDINHTSEAERASICEQQIEYEQTGKNITISGDIVYTERDQHLGSGYFVSAKFAMPEIQDLFFDIDAQDVSVSLLKKNSQQEYEQVSVFDYYVEKYYGYFEIAFKVESKNDQFKLVVNWKPEVNLVDEIYDISFANSTQLVLVGTDVNVYTSEESAYGSNDAVLTQTTATLYGQSTESIVYEVDGVIGWTQANNNFGITSDGFVVAFTFAAPYGIVVDGNNVSASYQRGQYVTGRFGDMIDIDKTNDAFAKFNGSQITLYFKVSDISDAFKISVSWDGVSTETFYIGLSEDLRFEITQDLTISASKTFSGLTSIVGSTITVASGQTLTINGVLTLSAEPESGDPACFINNGTISFGTNGSIVVDDGCSFVNNGKIVNYDASRIIVQNQEQANAVSGVVAVNDATRAEAFSTLKNAIIQTADGGTITLLENQTETFEIQSADVTTEKAITIQSPDVVMPGQELPNKTICPFVINNTNIKIEFLNIDFVTDENNTYNITTNILGKLVEIEGDYEYVTQLSFMGCSASTGMLILSENLTSLDESAISQMTQFNFNGISFENGTILSVYDTVSQKYTMDVISSFDALKDDYASDAIIVYVSTYVDVSGRQKLLDDGQTFAFNGEFLEVVAAEPTEIEINCNLLGVIAQNAVVIETANVSITNAEELFSCYILDETDKIYFADIEDAYSFADKTTLTQIHIIGQLDLTSTTVIEDDIEFLASQVVVTGQVTLPENTILHILANGTLTLNAGATLSVASPLNIVLSNGATKQGTGNIELTIDSAESVTSFESGYLYNIVNCNISGAVNIPNDTILKVTGTLILQNGTLTIPYENLIVENGATITGTRNLTVVMPTNVELTNETYLVGGATYNITNANVTTNFEMDEYTVFNISGNFVVANDCVFTVCVADHFVTEAGANVSGTVNYVQTISAQTELSTFAFESGKTYIFEQATLSGDLTIPTNVNVELTSLFEVSNAYTITVNGKLKFVNATIDVAQDKLLTISQSVGGTLVAVNTNVGANGGVVVNGATNLNNLIVGATYNFSSLTLTEEEYGCAGVEIVVAGTLTVAADTTLSGRFIANDVSIADGAVLTIAQGAYLELSDVSGVNITSGAIVVNGDLSAENGLTIQSLATLTIGGTGCLMISKTGNSGELTLQYDTEHACGASVVFFGEGLEQASVDETGQYDFSTIYDELMSNAVPE